MIITVEHHDGDRDVFEFLGGEVVITTVRSKKSTNHGVHEKVAVLVILALMIADNSKADLTRHRKEMDAWFKMLLKKKRGN